jgi:hypothetical protein
MSRVSAYEPNGSAAQGRVALAGALDAVAAFVVTMLLWPFPLFRLTLGVSWPVHILAILAGWLVVLTAYLTLTVAALGRTPAMYLLDLGLAGAERPFGLARSVRWAAGWTLAVLPGLIGARGLIGPERGIPARLSGLVTVATRS